jgi:hypothetical protein
MRSAGGYKLSPTVRLEFDKKYGQDQTSHAVTKLLTDLPAKVANGAAREYLEEALACYRAKAYRATIVMAWNLAYDHLVEWILADPGRTKDFNAAILVKLPKKGVTVGKREDFDDLKESELIAVCRQARLIDKNTTHILEGKLTKRNTAAHPSRIKITQHQADDAISDLVNNVILVLN